MYRLQFEAKTTNTIGKKAMMMMMMMVDTGRIYLLRDLKGNLKVNTR